MEVVVVLPCMPATAMPYLRRMSSASISARWMTGILRARASSDLGIGGRDGGAGDDDVGGGGVGRGVALEDVGAERGEAVGDGGAAQVGAGDGVAHGEQDLGDAAHADAADANEVNAMRGREEKVAGDEHIFVIPSEMGGVSRRRGRFLAPDFNVSAGWSPPRWKS